MEKQEKKNKPVLSPPDKLLRENLLRRKKTQKVPNKKTQKDLSLPLNPKHS
jgi:hypothetical protein